MATIKDVALMADVSVTTVSRVLNNRGYISDETRTRVHDAMAELEYSPHQVARALSMKQSFLLGLILPDASHPFFGQIVKAVEETAQTYGYKVLICNSLNDGKKESEYIRMLNENRVDGIIIGSHTLELASYETVKGPVISFERNIRGVTCISSDNFLGGQLATGHLIDRGCRSLLHISGSADLEIMSNRRSDAFRLTCMNHGVGYRIMEYEYRQLTFERDERFIREKIAPVIGEFDGVFCSNDYLAYALYLYCRDAGIDVPGELKIVGYDYSTFSRVLRSPRLTSVAQPIELMGRILCEGIIQLIEKKEVHSQQVDVKLILGETS